MIRNRQHFPKAFITAAQLVSITLLLLFLYVAKPILIPLAFAALFSLMLFPLANFFEKNGFPRIIAITLTLLLSVAFISGVIFLLSSQIYSFVSNLDELAASVDELVLSIEWWVYDNFNIRLDRRSGIMQDTFNRFAESGVLLLSGTISTFMGIFNFVALVPIYIFMFLLYRNSFTEFALIVTPVEKHRVVRLVVYQVQKVVQNYIIGLLTVMVIVGILNTVALLVIGVDYALFFGFLAALLTIIPYIGIIFGSLLPALYAFVTMHSIVPAILIIICFLVVQFLEGNFITPRITGNKVKINPLAAIIALLVGGYLWGTAGLVIFIPLAAMLKVVFDNIPAMRPYGFLLGTEIYGREKAAFAEARPGWSRRVIRKRFYQRRSRRERRRAK